jgi:hypothetical protein
MLTNLPKSIFTVNPDDKAEFDKAFGEYQEGAAYFKSNADDLKAAEAYGYNAKAFETGGEYKKNRQAYKTYLDYVDYENKAIDDEDWSDFANKYG